MPSTSTAPAPDNTALLWWLLLVAGAASFAVFAFAASQRLPYPHELEWMEGALADHAARIADGLPLYCEPTAEHLPFLYAPLLFWIGGLGMKLGLDGIVALRVCACAFSIGTAMLIGHWARRETGRVVPGLVATGLFFAGYGWLAWWYDLARNDSLFVFWTLLAAYLLRHGGRAGWFAAGLAATVALLAKQSALMWLPAIFVGALLLDWRRAVLFGLTAFSGIAAAVGVMHLTSDGWSTFYLFEMPRHHGWNGDRKLGFWTEDVVPMLPLLALGLLGFSVRLRAERGPALYLAALGSGGLLCSWLSRLHVGGFENVLMYGFAGACILGPIAACAQPRWLRVIGPLLLIVQFGWLGLRAWQRPTATLLPSAAHRQAHDELSAFVEQQDGPVWIHAHGHIAYRADSGTGAHGQAIFDLFQLLPKLPDGNLDPTALGNPAKLAHLSQRGRDALDAFVESARALLEGGHFVAIVVDKLNDPPTDPFSGLFGPFLGGYRVDENQLLTNPEAIDPLIGFHARSPHVLLRTR